MAVCLISNADNGILPFLQDLTTIVFSMLIRRQKIKNEEERKMRLLALHDSAVPLGAEWWLTTFEMRDDGKQSL